MKILSLPMLHLTANCVTSYLFMRIRNRIYFMRDWTKFLVCWLSTNAQTFSFIRVWDRLYYEHNAGLDWPLFWFLRILVGVSDYMKVSDQALAVSTSGSLKEVSELEVPSTGSAVGNLSNGKATELVDPP